MTTDPILDRVLVGVAVVVALAAVAVLLFILARLPHLHEAKHQPDLPVPRKRVMQRWHDPAKGVTYWRRKS